MGKALPHFEKLCDHADVRGWYVELWGDGKKPSKIVLREKKPTPGGEHKKVVGTERIRSSIDAAAKRLFAVLTMERP